MRAFISRCGDNSNLARLVLYVARARLERLRQRHDGGWLAEYTIYAVALAKCRTEAVCCPDGQTIRLRD